MKKLLDNILSFFKSRNAKHGSVSLAIAAVFIAVIVIFNMVAGLLVERVPSLSADLTANKIFELQPQTIDYIKDIKSHVTIYVLMPESNFTANGDYFLQCNKLLKQFVQYNKNISLKYIDVVTTPTFTSKYDKIDWDKSSNMILVENTEEGSDNYRVIPYDELFETAVDYSTYSQYIASSNVEQAVTTAILNVLNTDKVKYALIAGMGDGDTGGITSLLDKNAYEMIETNLAVSNIDPNCAFAILYEPSVDLSADALEKINKFLENDGQYGKTLMYMPYSQKTETPNINQLLKNWNMELTEGIVVETDSQKISLTNPPYIFLADLGESYKENLKNPSVSIIVIKSFGIRFLNNENVKSMLTSSSQSYVYPFDAGEEFDYESAIEGKTIAVAASSAKYHDGNQSNLIVFGSSNMFQSNVLSVSSYNNGAYFVNVCNTVANRDDIGITIEGKTILSNELSINAAAGGTIGTFFIFVLPIGLLILGLIRWIFRRNL